MNNQEQAIGAMWNKMSAGGRPYVFGKITIDNQDISIVCFQNPDKKSTNNLPDMLIYKSDPSKRKSNKQNKPTQPQPEEEKPPL